MHTIMMVERMTIISFFLCDILQMLVYSNCASLSCEKSMGSVRVYVRLVVD